MSYGWNDVQRIAEELAEAKPGVDPFSIYRSLRIVNPSPYMYFLRFGSHRPSGRPEVTHIVGSSPELLVRVHQQLVEYRPIAGTRLIREYQGIEHCVTVRRDDFDYLGTPYKSLSAIARAITGTRWNGLVFFGLKNQRAQS